MTNINGMTKDDWKQFTDLLKKANTGQIQVMSEELDQEEKKRFTKLQEIARKHMSISKKRTMQKIEGQDPKGKKFKKTDKWKDPWF